MSDMIEFQNDKFRVEMDPDLPSGIDVPFHIYMIDGDSDQCAYGLAKYDGQIDLEAAMRICNTTTVEDFCDILKRISERAIESLNK